MTRSALISDAMAGTDNYQPCLKSFFALLIGKNFLVNRDAMAVTMIITFQNFALGSELEISRKIYQRIFQFTLYQRLIKRNSLFLHMTGN